MRVCVVRVSPGKLRIFRGIDFNLCLVLCGSEYPSTSESKHANTTPSLDYMAAARLARLLSLNWFLGFFNR